jgi:carbohydrate diacid regulator
MGVQFYYYAENSRPKDAPVCDRQFEGVTDDGEFTYFRFLYKNVGYVGAVRGVTETERNYAFLLPSYIEGFTEKETELSKTEYLKRILLGECSSMGLYKYAMKYSVRGAACFVIALRVPKLMQETIAVLEQYGGNSLDTVVQMSEQNCVLVKFLEEDSEYSSSVDYAEFLVQSIKEELGVTVHAGVGPTVRELKDSAISYATAENALRYADVFKASGNVHSYRDFILIKMLEDIPESKLSEYLVQLSDEHSKEIFEDEDMLGTAEAFLDSSLNVSETSRNLYMHRNTLLYRLDKIEKATGLNVRDFSDAVSFRVLTILHKLLKK